MRLFTTIFLLVVSSSFISIDILAQNFALNGKIIDDSSAEPVEFATVSVLNQSDSSLVTGGVSNFEGKFNINTSPGNYVIKVSFVSYETKVIGGVSVNESQPTASLGEIRLEGSATSLAEVEIEGERSRLVMDLDKRVFVVEKDLANLGGSASDVLDNIPSIMVDAEGNVSLRGNNNVRILVNGQQSGMLGIDGISGLRSMRTTLDKYTDLSLNSAENAHSASIELSESIFINSMIVAFLVMIFIVGGGFYLKRSISKPLKEAMTIVDMISKGDLRVKINRQQYNPKDQIGFLLLKIDDMAKSQRNIIRTVKKGADYINRASEELNSSAGQLSQGASLQASSVEEVSSSMEQMAANIQQNTDNAKETEHIALSSNKSVESSNKSVEETLDSMSTIVRKNSIIGEIARQTNLLALNAAVEAARAGEHGIKV